MSALDSGEVWVYNIFIRSRTSRSCVLNIRTHGLLTNQYFVGQAPMLNRKPAILDRISKCGLAWAFVVNE